MKKKKLELLKITTKYWARQKETLLFEIKAKDLHGNKYTFTATSKEPIPVKGQKQIVTDKEWNRLKHLMQNKIDKEHNRILAALKKVQDGNNVSETA